ncbi:MAG TPA: histidine phosphatase family protein, partial [Kofleriaceae bacterium]|nr:histidine phosphatase family protein [Kofleriaceae bacterium]
GVLLVMVRHGEQERTGQDGPLTARGLRQAAAVASAVSLAASDLLVSSSRLRARQTAAAIAAGAEVIDDLDEYRFGPDWTWQHAETREDLLLWQPDHHAGGETMAEFQQRIDRVMESLVRREAPRRILLCVHSGVIDAIVRWAFGITPDVPWTTEVNLPHASITELQHWHAGRHPRGAPRHTLLIRVGDVAHLAVDIRSE